MKKLLAILFVLSLTFTCWSCGDDDEPEQFVWNGDWNDPADPNYKPEGYNPIQGLWRDDKDNTRGVYYSPDFKIYQAYFHSDGYVEKSLWTNKYIINDKAYNTYSKGIRRYKIEGDILNITYEMNKDDNWQSYTWVEK